MILVEVRCKFDKCRKLLTEVGDAPTDEVGWTRWGQFPVCPRHGDGAGHGNIAARQERQRRAGKPTDEVREQEWRQWSDLRPKVEKALSTGEPQVFLI